MTTSHYSAFPMPHGSPGGHFKTPVGANDPFNLANIGIMLAVRGEVLAEWALRGVTLSSANMASFVDEVHARTLEITVAFRDEAMSGAEGAVIGTMEERHRAARGRTIDQVLERRTFTTRPAGAALTRPAGPAGPTERKPAAPTERKEKPLAVVDLAYIMRDKDAAKSYMEGLVGAGKRIGVYWPHEAMSATRRRLKDMGLSGLVDEVLLRRPRGRVSA